MDKNQNPNGMLDKTDISDYTSCLCSWCESNFNEGQTQPMKEKSEAKKKMRKIMWKISQFDQKQFPFLFGRHWCRPTTIIFYMKNSCLSLSFAVCCLYIYNITIWMCFITMLPFLLLMTLDAALSFPLITAKYLRPNFSSF